MSPLLDSLTQYLYPYLHPPPCVTFLCYFVNFAKTKNKKKTQMLLLFDSTTKRKQTQTSQTLFRVYLSIFHFYLRLTIYFCVTLDSLWSMPYFGLYGLHDYATVCFIISNQNHRKKIKLNKHIVGTLIRCHGA